MCLHPYPKQASVHFFEIEYTTARGLPHSMQRDFDLDVINPQDGHILWPDPATSDFVSRIQRSSSRTVNNTTSRPKEILPALIKSDPSGRVLHRPGWSLSPRPASRSDRLGTRSLANGRD
jgi:hypothetical protein